MPRKILESCLQLKIIGKYCVGIENVDVEAATEMGIPVVNLAGGSTPRYLVNPQVY
jgi:D-3-phosphoglycerate dehydrogenase